MENCDFWPYKKIPFCGLKRFLFCLKLDDTFFKRILRKIKYNFLQFFWPKSWVTPFGELRLIGLMKSEHFFGLKIFPFYLEHKETLFLRLFWGKTNKEKNLNFWIKIVD